MSQHKFTFFVCSISLCFHNLFFIKRHFFPLFYFCKLDVIWFKVGFYRGQRMQRKRKLQMKLPKCISQSCFNTMEQRKIRADISIRPFGCSDWNIWLSRINNFDNLDSWLSLDIRKRSAQIRALKGLQDSGALKKLNSTTMKCLDIHS